MSRNKNRIGALAALFIASLITASIAQAEVTFTSGFTGIPDKHTSTTVHATQYSPTGGLTDNAITSGFGPVTCSNISTTFTGFVTSTDRSLTLTPQYIDCRTITSKDAGGTPVTVTMNGCDYLLNQSETIFFTERYTGTFNLVCPAGKKMEINIYASGTETAHSVKICTLGFSEQKTLSHIVYENNTSGAHDDIDMTIAAGKMVYTSSGVCGVTIGNASYNSSLTLTATGFHDLWLSD